MSSTSSKIEESTPVSTSKVELLLIESPLEPFDQNYTLTGLIKDIQVSINQLVKSKKQAQEQVKMDLPREISILQKIQDEVSILKVIIAHNINSIFSSIYPSHMLSKSENSTDHQDSNRQRNEEENLNKSMTISDFNIEANHKINNLEISKENLAYYQKRYAEQKQGENVCLGSGRVSNRKNLNSDTIRIQDDGQGSRQREDSTDLICHEDETTIIINRRRNNIEDQKQHHFSPIEQRPVEQEYSMQKGARLQQNKENMDRNIMFNHNRQNLYIKIGRHDYVQLKKSLFSQKSQSFKRVSHRKFNYLEQLNKY